MLNLLFILLFTISHTIPLNCMEPTSKKPSKEKMDKKKSKSLLSLSRKSSNEKNEEKSTLEHPFTIAVRMAIESKDYTAVKFHMRNPHLDPNITDKHGYSALQNFIKEKAYPGITLLLPDHRVHVRYEDLYKKETSQEDANQQQKFIIDYIDKNNNRELYLNIFGRFTLDMVTTQQCNNMQPFYERSLLTDTALTSIIKKIRDQIENDANKQNKDREDKEGHPALPESACLPDYATDEFIENRIWSILSSSQHEKNT
jgi:hypothetical protein